MDGRRIGQLTQLVMSNIQESQQGVLGLFQGDCGFKPNHRSTQAEVASGFRQQRVLRCHGRQPAAGGVCVQPARVVGAGVH